VLAMFNTAMVMPTYYICFMFCTLLTSVILYQDFRVSATNIITITKLNQFTMPLLQVAHA